jgi:hypothetical protein
MSFSLMYDEKSFTPHVQFVMCQIFNTTTPHIRKSQQYLPEAAIFINKNSIASDISKIQYTLRALHRTSKEDRNKMMWRPFLEGDTF